MQYEHIFHHLDDQMLMYQVSSLDFRDHTGTNITLPALDY